ncbi:MAG: hypothetical protein JW723_13505 [Bacteroidales bacterium]|nr:hypothetical protein [Bacteroidales bacterium]
MKECLLIVLAVFTLSDFTFAQDNITKFSLLTERAVDRPLTMHKGQLQANIQYGFSRNTLKYNDFGSSLNLQEEGIAFSDHVFEARFSYGLFEMIEINAEAVYQSSIERKAEYMVLSEEGIRYYSEFTEAKGFKDIYLGAKVRPLPDYDFFDLCLENGITFPTASFNPDLPEHEFELNETEENISYIKYHYNENHGTGVAVYYIGVTLKIRLQRMAFLGSFKHQRPLKEGIKTEWRSSLTDSRFDYAGLNYKFKPNNTSYAAITCHYQLFPWFDLYGDIQYQKSSGGWSYQLLQQRKDPVEKVISGCLGYEIQASPLIRIFQHINFSMTGQNTNGYYLVITGASFNLFPFYKE